MATSNRIHELDSLRGIAALIVVVHHTLLVFPILYDPYISQAFQEYGHMIASSVLVKTLVYSPLHLLWGGHEAVILFFVLSGFVLALPFLEGEPPRYKDYLVKRVCRIYLPYLAAVSVSGALMTLLSRNGIIGLSSWFNKMWSEPLNGYTVIDQLLMLGNTTHNVNTVTWSLVHEMRISLVFPFVVRLVRKRQWWVTLFIAGLASAAAFVANKVYPLNLNVYDTLHYGALFVVGALLARFRHQICDKLRQIKPGGRALILVLAGFLVNWQWQTAGTHILLTNGFVRDWAITSGTVAVLAMVLSTVRPLGFLNHRWTLWLGKVSYSLYLVHIPVLLTLCYTLGSLWPLPVVLALTPVVSLLMAGLTYKIVELPAIRLGRHLTSGAQSRVTTSSPS